MSKPSKSKGRPTKLTPKLQKEFCDVLRAGNTRSAACAYTNISYQSFLNWLERGEEAGEGIYFDFLENVAKAESAAEIRNVALIQTAAKAGTWQAAAWWLERRRPKDYSRHTKLVHEGGDKPIKTETKDTTEPPPPERALGHLKTLQSLMDSGVLSTTSTDGD